MIVRAEWYARDFSAGWWTGSFTNMTLTPWSWIVSPVTSNPESSSGQSFQLGSVLLSFVCLTTLSMTRTVQHRMTGWSVRNELLGIWKGTVLVLTEVLHKTDFSRTPMLSPSSTVITLVRINTFNIHVSAYNNNIPVQKSQQDAHAIEFILSGNCFTCFGYHHPSSGAQNNCN
jgi:hypothetical protein